MTMGFGMIGALGGFGGGTGIGGAMMNEAAIMQKDEERVKARADQMAMEEWRLKTAEGYNIKAQQRAEEAAIRAEGRAEEGVIRADTRNWGNEQTREPVRAKIASDAAIAGKKADLQFTTDNLETISTNTKTLKEAGETESERVLRGAQADYYRDRGAATAAGSGGKIPEGLKLQYKDLTDEINDKQKLIDTARAKGEWTTQKDKDGAEVSGTPEQRQLLREVAVLKTQRLALVSQMNGASAPAGDPIGLRGGAAAKGVNLDKPAGAAPMPAASSPGVPPAPAAKPAASNDLPAKVERLRQGVGAAPATAPAAPDAAVKTALGAGGSSAIDQIVGERAPALMQAADELKAAQQQVARAAQAQQPEAVTRAVAAAAAAGSRLDALLKGMMPAQQKKVREALGV